MDSTNSSERAVPAKALQFAVGSFELGSNGDNAKSAPFKMTARSGQPIEHWFWGRVVHDMDGMKLSKNRVAIDYAHDPKEIIGYANHFETDSGDLVVSGALVPFKENDRATEIMHKQREGIPYEASINFSGDGIRVEEIREGQTASVNGYSFSGPGMIIREWPLRGIAVCPYGADQNTSTEFSSGETVTVTMETQNMKTELTAAHIADVELKTDQPAAEEPASVEATEQVVSDNAEAPAETPEVVEAVPAAAELSQSKSEGIRFLEAFGDRGGVWFAQGMSFESAQMQYIESLKAEVEQLKQRLSAARIEGESDPVEFSQHVVPKPKARLIRLAGK